MKTDDIFTVLVVEDEPIILDNIVKKIEKSIPRIQVTGKAQSSEKALEILRNQTFDILITDIEMPGVSGLELIREVKDLYPNLHIVILSGYSNFEYARTALRYGVEDYLLKPLEQHTLSDLLHRLCRQITEEKQTACREILCCALNNDTPRSPLPSLFKKDSFCLVHISIGNVLPAQIPLPRNYIPIFSNLWGKLQFEENFRNLQGADHLWIIDENSPMQKFLILHMTEEETPTEYFRVRLNNYLKSMLKDTPYTLLVLDSPVSYYKLWEKAEFLRSAAGIHARLFSQISAVIKEESYDVLNSGDEVLMNMEPLFSISDNTHYMQHVRSALPDAFDFPSAVFVKCINQIYDSISRVFHISSHECDCAETAFLSALTIGTSQELCMQNLEYSLLELWENDSAPVTGTSLCRKIAQYMEHNLRKPFSLSELASHFGYTPSYINRIFKKEYGFSPLQYLTALRISRAKEILQKNPNINIRQVAETVGYEDARYFSRIFKNETGVTPSIWAERIKCRISKGERKGNFTEESQLSFSRKR